MQHLSTNYPGGIGRIRGPGSFACKRSPQLLMVVADPNGCREPPLLSRIANHRRPALVIAQADDAKANTPETTQHVRSPNEEDSRSRGVVQSFARHPDLQPMRECDCELLAVTRARELNWWSPFWLIVASDDSSVERNCCCYSRSSELHYAASPKFCGNRLNL